LAKRLVDGMMSTNKRNQINLWFLSNFCQWLYFICSNERIS